MKSLARQLFLDALARIDLRVAMLAHINCDGERLRIYSDDLDLRGYTNILVIAFGKASVSMASVVANVLNKRLTAGVIVTNALPEMELGSLANFEIFVGGHPVPNEGSLRGAKRILELLGQRDERTLVIFLVSGGGSALVEKPISDSISLDDLQQLNRLLVTSGATIREINAVRKHLSAIKGGRLAQWAYPARQVTLYVSDVNPGDFATIASSPTGPDDTTVDDVYDVIERYRLLERLPPTIARIIKARELAETPKPGDASLSRSSHHLVMDNEAALKVTEALARERELTVAVDSETIEGYYREVADRLLERLVKLRDANPERMVCLLSGGEVSCPVKGTGIGGRNQEFVLYSALKLPELAAGGEIAVLSAGTDGIDGISPAAGAVAD